MRISQRQSVVIVIGVLLAFFAGTALLVRSHRDATPLASGIKQSEIGDLSQGSIPKDPIPKDSIPKDSISKDPISEDSTTEDPKSTDPIANKVTPLVVERGDGTVAAPETSQRFVLDKFHRSETKDGKKLWEVTASRGEYQPTNNSAVLRNAVLEMAQGKSGSVEIRSDDATLFLKGTGLDRAELQGNVVLIQNKKTTLTSDQAVYDRTKNTITIPGSVRIDGPLLEILGTGLTGDLEKQQFTLASQVVTTIKPRQREGE
jgi:LPS export ABC transporter protein LptC